MGLPWYHYVVVTVVFTIAVIIVSGIVAGICRAIPSKHVHVEKKLYNPSEKMLNFYRKIGVKKWKDHIPELGQFTGFHKNEVAKPQDNEYLNRFIYEACYGVLGHLWSMPISFVILFIDYGMWTNGSNIFLTIGVPVAFVSAALNYMPYCVLRFNIPRLRKLFLFNQRQQKLAK